MLQPVARITLHLEGFDNDRLCEELGVSDDARKKFKSFFFDLESNSTQKGKMEKLLSKGS